MKKLIRFIDINFEPIILMVSFLVMMTLISVQVFLRFIMGSGFAWGEEVSTFLFVWIVFTGISYAFRNNRQISVDFLKNLLPESIRKILTLIIEISMLVMVIILLTGAWSIVQNAALFGDKAAALPISLNWLNGAAVYGFVLSAIRIIQSIIWKLRRFGASYELYMNVGGTYSGAAEICFMPQSYRDEVINHSNPDCIEEEKKYSGDKGGNE